MVITKLDINNFRNLNLKFEPQAGFNLILGKNGTGKSNFLDSIYHLSLAKSFKPYTLKNNVNFEKPEFAVIEANIEEDDIQKELRIVFATSPEIEYEKKRLFVNTKATIRAKFINNISVILFAPHNTNLLTSSPDIRRLELDDFASSFDFKYALTLNEYKELIKTRNSLLRVLSEGNGGADQLDYWDSKLVQLGAKLIIERKNLIERLNPIMNAKAKSKFNEKLNNLEIVYITKFNSENPKKEFEEKIKENRFKEIAAGQTLYGPHKDDFMILNNEKDLKLFGSRGQQRISTLLFKLSMWQYIFDSKGIKPIILLDDAMAELDDENKISLEKIIEELDTQTFIATTHIEDYSKRLLEKMSILKLE